MFCLKIFYNWLFKGKYPMRIEFCFWKSHWCSLGVAIGRCSFIFYLRNNQNSWIRLNSYIEIFQGFCKKYSSEKRLDRKFMKNILENIVELFFSGQISLLQNFENHWNNKVYFLEMFKIILINESSFEQIYSSEANFSGNNFWALSGFLLNQWK